MKIKIRDVGSLTVGFILGALVMLLSLAPTPPQVRPAVAPRFATTGTVIDVASLPRLVITNLGNINLPVEQPTLRGLRRVGELERLDARGLFEPARPGSVDLIDTRYRPDIQLDELK